MGFKFDKMIADGGQGRSYFIYKEIGTKPICRQRYYLKFHFGKYILKERSTIRKIHENESDGSKFIIKELEEK